MGADIIGVGWTAKKGSTPALEATETMALLFKHRQALLESGVLDFFIDEEPDGEFLKKIGEGLNVLQQQGPARATTQYDIVGTEFVFFFAGGTSYGDEPFDHMDELEAAIFVSERFPEIGDRVGVVGSGVLPFGRP